jgi:hypothetical protein
VSSSTTGPERELDARGGASLVAEHPSSTPPVRAAIPWRQIVIQAVLLWVVTRLVYVFFTYFAAAFFLGGPTTLHTLIASWHQFDANWYTTIAQRGYWNLESAAFFPLLPLLIKIMSLVLGGSHYTVAAIVVANLGTLAALIGLGAVSANESWTARHPWRTIAVTLAYPFAFYLVAPYTEGLFLASATFCLFCARRGYWGRMALCAFVAVLTRPTAVVLVLPMLWEYGRQHGWWQLPLWKRAWWRAQEWRQAAGWDMVRARLASVPGAIAIGAVVPSVMGVYMLYTWVRFGHPLLIFKVHKLYWNRTFVPIWDTAATMVYNALTLPFGDLHQAMIIVDGSLSLAFIVLTLLYLRRIPVAYSLYMIGLLGMTLMSPTTTSLILIDAAGRFLLVGFPVFLLLARLTEERPWLETLVMAGGYLFQALFALAFLSHLLLE